VPAGQVEQGRQRVSLTGVQASLTKVPGPQVEQGAQTVSVVAVQNAVS
jgi:hypothetical protein